MLSPASHRVEGRCHVCYHQHRSVLKVGVMYVITSTAASAHCSHCLELSTPIVPIVPIV